MKCSASTAIFLIAILSSSGRGQDKTTPPARRDRYGDPLPAGALARLGTLRFRTGISSMPGAAVRGWLRFMSGDKELMTGGGNDGVRIWDLSTGRQVRRLSGSLAALSDDGKIMAAWEQGGIALYDTTRGAKTVDVREEFRTGGQMLFAPDGKVLARIRSRPLLTPRADKGVWNTISRWSTATGKPLSTFHVEAEEITEAAFSPDGKLLGVGDDKGFIHLLDAGGGKTVRNWQAHAEHVLTLRYSRDGKVLVSCGSDDKICLWKPESGQKLREILPLGLRPRIKAPLALRAQSRFVLVLSPNGKTLAVGSTQKLALRTGPAFELWHTASGEKIVLKTAPPLGTVQDLAFSHDGRVLAGLTDSGVIALWDAESGRRLNPDTADENPIEQLAVFPDGKRLATQSGDSVRIWNLESAKEQERIARPNLKAMALSPDGGHLAALTFFDGFIWDAKTGQVTNLPLQSRTQHKALAYSPDGAKLALARGGQLVLVDARTGSEIWTSGTRGAFRGITDVVFAPDGTFVATAGFQGPISVWNAANGKWLRDLGGPTGTSRGKGMGKGKFAAKGRGGFGGGGFGGRLRQIAGFALSPDGRMLAAVMTQGPFVQGTSDLSLWETATGASRGAFPVLALPFNRDSTRLFTRGGGLVRGAPVAFSSDSRLIALGSRTGDISIIDLATGSKVEQLTGHGDAINCLAFSGDGGRLFSGSEDTTVLVWDVTAASKAGQRSVWEILAAADAAAAYQAIGQLAASPAKTLPELKKRLPELANPLAVARALEVLERIGSAEARALLDDYAHHGRIAGSRQDAAAASERLLRHDKDTRQSGRLVIKSSGKDQDGNDLPEGTVARLGTARYRFVSRSPQGPEIAAFLDDKNLIISGRSDLVAFVDLATGKSKRWFRAEKEGWYIASQWTGFALSADGKTLASGPFLWEVPSGNKGREIGRVFQGDEPLALSADGKLIALQEGRSAFRRNGKILLWNTDTEEKQPLEGTGTTGNFVLRARSLQRFAFSADRKLLAGTATDGELGIWDVATAKLQRKWPVSDSGAPGADLSVLGFSAGDELLVTAVHARTGPEKTMPGKVILWDPRSGKQVRRLNEARMSAEHAVLSVDGRKLATSFPGTIAVWQFPSGKLVRKIACPGSPGALAFSRDGQTLASVGSVIRLWDLKRGRQLSPEEGHSGPVAYVAVLPAGDAVVSAGGGTVIVWDTTGKEQRRFGPGISAAALAPDGKTLALAEKGLSLRDLASGKELPAPPGPFENIQSLTFAPGSRVLALRDAGTSFWDMSSRTLLWKLEPEPKSSYPPSIAFTPDGKYAAVFEAGTTRIALREVASGKVVRILGQASGRVARMSFSGDGRSLMLDASATPGFAGPRGVPLTILETAGGKERLRLLRPNGPRALSPDGRFVAVANPPGEIDVLELPSGNTAHAFPSSGVPVLALAFSPDGRLLFSGGADTSVLVWDLTPGAETSPKPLDTWAVLAGNDAARAYRTMWTLVRSPVQTTNYLRQELTRRHAASSPAIAKLIADLDSGAFKVREQASAALIKLGAPAELALEGALSKVKSLESRRRIQRLLEKMDSAADLSTDQVAVLRAFEVLERIASNDAREALAAFARKGSSARLRRAAAAAIKRLDAKRASARLSERP